MAGWWAETHTPVLAATLHITGGTPTIVMVSSRMIIPAPAVLTITRGAPASLGIIIRPGAASLTITGSAPGVNKGLTVTPAPAGTAFPYTFPIVFGSLGFTGRTPTVTVTNNKVVQPTPAALTLTGGTPTIPAPAKPVIVGVNTSAANTVAIPTHAVGNLIVIYAFARNSVTEPSVPTPGGTVPAWVSQTIGPGSGICTGRVATFVATATNHTSGTWTGAFGMIATVVSGQSGIGGAAADGGGTFDATAPPITMADTDGTSLLLHHFGARSGGAAATWGAAPSGYTQKATDTLVCLDTKNITTTDGAVTQTRTGATVGYDAHTLEILAP